jgi:chemotaxis protein histidine kinase CheA
LSAGNAGTAGLEEAFAALREAYAVDLPGLLRDLEASLDEAAVHPDAAARAARQAHRIRGTAGSYGFAEVTEITGQIEDAIDEGRPVAPELRRALAALVLRCEEGKRGP